MKRYPIITALAILSVACHSTHHEEKSIVAEWTGRHIVIPEELTFQILGENIDPDLPAPDFKIVTYIDSTGCTDCRMKLHLWNETINEFKSLPDVDVEVLTIINSPLTRNLTLSLKSNHFAHPVAMDSENIFDKANKLHKKTDYHTFLLDRDNNVLALGNPAINPKIKELYKTVILNGDEIRFGKAQSYPLGMISRNDSTSITVNMENKDSITLNIQALITSCDCTTATINTTTIATDSTASVCITFIADTVAGRFSRYVDMFYEEKEYPDRLTVYGYIK